MRDRSQARCVLVQPQVATVLVIVADVSLHERCLRCLLLVMCTYPCAKKALTLHLARGEGRERYFGCNLMQRKVLASSYQHLMAEAPVGVPIGNPNEFSNFI